MELVYLWVEKYKNIVNQGFNFSPKFECNFDGNRLNIKDKYEDKKYTSIYSDNINITAIVGKNGSGKSTLTEIILKILFEDEFRKNRNTKKNKSCLLIVKTIDGLKFYSNHINLKNKLQKNKFKFITIEQLKSAYYLLIDFSLGQNAIYNSKNKYKIDYALEPSRIAMTESSKEFLGKIESNAFNNNMKVNSVFFYFFINKLNMNYILDELELPNLINIEYLKPSSYSSKNRTNMFTKFKSDNLNFNGLFFNNFNSFEDITSSLKKKFSNDFKINDLTESDLYILENIFYFVSLNIKNNIITFDSLSSGQKLLISYLGIILRTIYLQKNKTSITIILDEIENSLHPEWQRLTVKNIISFLNKLLLNETLEIKFYNLLFLTHSPFILSDITKENIIFLENGKVTSPLKTNEQTFGANIHTLLSHGFFMEDGLMGEYAKEKINEVIQILKKDSLSSDEIKTCKDIISIIGEPILQKTLQSQLDMKLYPKETQLEKLEREQREIQAKIDELKKKNETD